MVVGSALAAEGVATLSSIVVGPDGAVDVPYDKQHLDGDERGIFTPGDHGASIRVGGIELGLSICYDGCFPEHARAAAVDGAAGYLNSAAYFTGAEHRRDLYYPARAVENGMYVVFAGLTGRCGSGDFSGGSAIYDPRGPAARSGSAPSAASSSPTSTPTWSPRTAARHTMLADHRDDLGERMRIPKAALQVSRSTGRPALRRTASRQFAAYPRPAERAAGRDGSNLPWSGDLWSGVGAGWSGSGQAWWRGRGTGADPARGELPGSVSCEP